MKKLFGFILTLLTVLIFGQSPCFANCTYSSTNPGCTMAGNQWCDIGVDGSTGNPVLKICDGTNFEIDITPIISNKSLRNLRLRGYFQKYSCLQPYKKQIREEWLKIAPELLLPKKENSIVVHVRTQYPPCYYIPFEYYRKALERSSYDQVYICTDDPASPFLEQFKRYNPIIVSTRNLEETLQKGVSWPDISQLNMDDFLFMLSFDKIICSFSTYSWWAAFLSEAKEIYAPYPTNPNFQYFTVDEARYHYIETTIGR